MKKRKKQKRDYQKLERELLALECRLTRELHEKLGNVHNTSLEDPTELLDMVSDGELDYMSALAAEAGSTTIEEIEHALRKIRERTYGICDACAQAISERRLKARPFAVLCVKCKERQERRGYAEGSSEVSVRGDASVMVNLTNDDVDSAEGSLEDIFRDVEDVGIY